MKATLLALFMVCDLGFQGLASAATPDLGALIDPDMNSEVLTHPMTVAVLALMNAAHGNSCAQPSAEDIRWGCLGALPLVTKPTLAPVSCLFNVSLRCGNNTATIEGQRVSYELLMPDHSLPNVTSTPIIEMHNVELGTAP